MKDHNIIYAFFKREMLYRFMNRVDLYILVFLPLLNLSIFLLIGKFARTFEYLGIEVDAVRFLSFSVILFLFSWHVVENIIFSAFEQRRLLLHYLETPAEMIHIILGSFLVGIVQTLLYLVIQLSYIRITGISLFQIYLIGCLTLINLISVLGLGLMIISVVFRLSKTDNILSATRSFMILLSGAYFPISLYPDYVQAIIRILPFSLYVEMTRGIYLSNEIPSYLMVAAFAAGSVVFLVAGILILNSMVKKSKKDGRIVM
jgi:ABC-type polysaccharide/polyol phosphate export permease